MPKCTFKNINIHFTSVGKGPAVVLLHGFLESSWMWSGMVKSLSARHRVVCVDLPGHGQSDCIGYIHTMEEMAEAVFEVLRTLKLRKVSMVGHSMGGYVALAFGDKYPDHLRSLTLLQSTARPDPDWKQRDRDRAIEMVKVNHSSFVRKAIPKLFRPINRNRLRKEVNEVKEVALKTPVQGIIAALGGMRDRPSRELILKFAPYPIHIVASDKDPVIAFDDMKALEAISDRVKLYSILGCGHMSYIEAPDETLHILKQIIHL